MFKEADRIKTPKGNGTITRVRKSSYSKAVLFYYVKLDSPQINEKNELKHLPDEEYICLVSAAEQLK